MSLKALRIRPFRAALVAVAILALTMSTGYALIGPSDGKAQYFGQVAAETPEWATELPTESAECDDGMAATFPCENVDLAHLLPLSELGGRAGNDVWGWTDPANGDEYALMGTTDGATFVDVTQPEDPDILGMLPTQSDDGGASWRDIKIHDNHAYVVSEHRDHGMQVFDLERLRDAEPVEAAPLREFGPDAVYTGTDEQTVGNTHNMFVNEDSGFAYLVGTSTCGGGGLHMVDVNDPDDPEFAGCFGEDGYTHDVQCVTYDGPDDAHQGDEICFASNEDSVTIVDVTDKSDPVEISRTTYDTSAYTHQGGLTDDQGTFLFNDEPDELAGTVDNTTTYFLDVSDLDRPGEVRSYAHESQTIDHNLYIDGSMVHQAHYNEGLRLSEIDVEDSELDEVAFFDVVPGVDVSEFSGAWSNFAFEDSGTIVVSAIEGGLFVLEPDLPEDERPGRGNNPGRGPGNNNGKGSGDNPGNGRGPDDNPGRGPGNGNGPGNGRGPRT